MAVECRRGREHMRVDGSLRVPGDKSISHRGLMLAALGDGTSRITGILQSADVASTAAVLRRLGATIPPLAADMAVEGVGLERSGRRLSPPSRTCRSGAVKWLPLGWAGSPAGGPVVWEHLRIAYVILKVLNIFEPVRVSEEIEAAGLDQVLHGETAYDLA